MIHGGLFCIMMISDIQLWLYSHDSPWVILVVNAG